MENEATIQSQIDLLKSKQDALNAIKKLTKAEVKAQIEAKGKELDLARVDYRIKKDSFDAIKLTVNSLNSEIELLKLQLKK